MDHHALRFLFLLIFATCSPFPFGFSGVLAAQNVTIDDGDAAIIYSPPGAWNRSASSQLDVNNSHMLTQNPNATATFNFTGTAIYFLSPLWPYNVTTLVTLDSDPPTLVDLQDHTLPDRADGPETVQSQVVWGAAGLANRQHTLRVSVGSGQRFAIVDGLIYTDANDAPSTIASAPRTASSSLSSPATSTQTGRVVASSGSNASSSSSSSSQKHAVAVALGTIFGILGLMIIIFGLWYCWKKGQRPVSEAWTIGAPTSSGGSPTRSRAGSGFSKVLGASGMASKNTKYDSGYDERGSGYTQPGYGYQMRQTPQGDWANTRYGQVGSPPPPISSPPPTQRHQPPQTPPPANGYAYQDENGYYHSNNPQPYYSQPPAPSGPPPVDPNARAPNRYEPGNTLSTITEKSTPQMPGSGGAGTRPLPPTSPAGENRTSLELGYFSPPAPQQQQQQHEGWGQNTTPSQAGWSVMQQQQQPTQSSPRARQTQASLQGRGLGELRGQPPSNGGNPSRTFSQKNPPDRWI